ncbi:Uncharacterized membrane protein [Clostridium acidisoli DSM 12555]|uniref:Uncharacterized membrane protein n=1 Tax=Clostridium acidisoli DSM 12555 TaxID=1121291 RepID=A0A1W1XSF9_9CLOT|nr:DUF975 family protein [Clostridium acidisoli]SMC26782.1 Uncharacterized membrane protein [Clostridium acidisoli DSM 12555]
MHIGQVKSDAKASLKNRKLKAAGSILVYLLLASIIPQLINYFLQISIGKFPGAIIGLILSIIVTSALLVGNYRYFISFSDRDKDTKLSLLFSGFDSFLKVIGFRLLLGLILGVIYAIIFGICFIIVLKYNTNPAVILILILIGLIVYIATIYVSLRLSFTCIIFAEEKTSGIIYSMKKSFGLSKGYTLKLFLLNLSFIGWALLCILIIPIFYVLPYIELSNINFYYKLKEIRENNITLAAE